MNVDLRQQGWSKMEGLLDSTKCSEIRAEADKLDLASVTTRVDVLPSETRVWCAERILSSVKELTDSDFIFYFERLFDQKFSFAIYNKIVQGSVGSGGGWHRDTRVKSQYKVIIYLTDCPDSDHGCFQYLPRSHSLFNRYRLLTISDLFSKPRYSILSPILQSASLSLTGSSGDSILVNTTGIHRGNPVKVGERHALTLYFDTGVKFDDK